LRLLHTIVFQANFFNNGIHRPAIQFLHTDTEQLQQLLAQQQH